MAKRASSKSPAAAPSTSEVMMNELIRASAGTGKTYALVQRYLWLLERGVEPERIAAMTFTRKAAGEFFERILQELATRGTKENGEAAIALLRKMVRRMDRLRLGTIDAFFMAMTQCLPFELGLTGQTGLMGEEDFVQARDEVLDSLMLSITRIDDRSMLDELREAWKDASHGHEQNRPAEALSSWCNRLHQLYIECSDAERWGGESVIWPDKKAGLELIPALNRLQSLLVLGTFDKRAQAKWEDFFLEVATLPVTGKLGGTVQYMMDSKRGVHADLRRGTDWMMWRKRMLTPDEGSALADVLDAIVVAVLKTHIRRSRAQCRIMQMYEGSYHRLVRGRGRLVFGDLAWLLSGRLGAGSGDTWESVRTAVEYRMDARYDHWLLDEFQDTSERQWEVLSPLLEEARQDVAEERSVFLVGDLKQSIYLWRQAEPEIFHHVEHTWAGNRLEITPLNQSYRSCPQVIEMVNTVFLEAEPVLEAMFPGIGHLWAYEEHRCSTKVAELSGHAALIHVGGEGEEKEGDADTGSDPLTDAVVTLIREINPLDRGLSCAVLVRKNDTARLMSDTLRARLGVEVICESEETVLVDNPATLALLSLVQLSVHPSDTLAWQHLSMTPLAAQLEKEEISPALLSARVRREISVSGFLPVLRDWAQQLRDCMTATDAFTERRLTQLLDFAAAFDETGSRDADDFLRRARAHALREDAVGARAIQVLTVHKSKGLQFDVVILPELQGEALDTVTRNRLFVSRSPRGGVQWILDKPDKIIIDADATLKAELQREQARRAFEGICRLYVSMTRAKLALYAITAERSRDSSRNEAGLLKQRLGATEPTPYAMGALEADCLWETGDRRWHHHIPEMPPVHLPELARTEGPKLGDLLREVNATVQRRAPSGEESFQLTGKEFASPAREVKRLHGVQVHEMLSLVPWLESAGDVRHRWQERGYDLDSAAAQQAWEVLQEPSINAWFTRGNSKREAWVEKRFDLVTGDGWISGILDRVVLETDGSGGYTSATILDFKTDEVVDEAALLERVQGYVPQLKLYHEAVQRLAGLPAVSVKAVLIFTASRRPWSVDLTAR
ncbi:ATP-dependent exoDNAse (exonuclease V) beta subunit [Roseimicrobium gellanilyticum]|uniref:DNA 3'-5' helicase n=1 Tax=Roseimicrobium gellanilyticum TaxID=748857 RepID=A0A366HRP6_9BACT|nr:UvrD-helicase domain-containing protein [Roseimicrobium gellanilyticum]RBP46355.1 ATP-dependent exoDNAse (exonuclease V) beta subunit [Roseimicrobium gellanilyticum]